MGKTYSHHEPYPEDKETVFVIKPYSSEYDNIFKYYETKLNLLKYLDVNEFQQLLYNFNCERDDSKVETRENLTKSEYEFEYDHLIGRLMYSVFLDKKIANHFLIFPLLAEDEKTYKQSLAFYHLMFENIYKNYKFYLKKLAREGENQKVYNDKIKKICLLSLAFLYCRAKSNYHKVLFIFNLFSNEKLELENTSEFEIFIFFILLYPSNIYLTTINDFGTEFEDLKIKEELFLKVYDTFEVKDSKRLLDSTMGKIFQGNKSIDFQKFSASLSKLDWLLTPSGIRKTLQETNDTDNGK